MNESLHALSGAYVVDALDDEERATFEAHLPGCLDCQREVASLREATALLADSAAVPPPPALRASVLAGIKTIRPLPPEVGAHAVPEPGSGPGATPPVAKVLPLRRRFVASRLMAAAAAVLVVAGGVTAWQTTRDDTSTNQLSAVDQVLAASDAKHVSIDFKDGSNATVVRSLSKGKAVLLTENMALPPAGKAFEVWLQDRTGTMVPAGMMKPQGDNKMLLEGDASKATGVGITVEPEKGSKTPTSEPIALFELDESSA